MIPSGLLDESSVCYCVGAGEDISFDTQLARLYGSSVWIMDPTPRAIRHFERLTQHVLEGKPFPVNNSTDVMYEITPEKLDRLHYLPLGLWTAREVRKFYAPRDAAHVSHSIVNLQKTDSWFEAEVKRLSQVMSDLGHARVDLLKLDVEGAEYEVLESMLEDGLDVRVVCVEHDEWNSGDSESRQRIAASMARMKKADYMVMHVENGANVLYVRKDVVKTL